MQTIEAVNKQESSGKTKRKKIVVIRRKKRDDGSVDCERQDIYKDYGNEFALNQQRKYSNS